MYFSLTHLYVISFCFLSFFGGLSAIQAAALTKTTHIASASSEAPVTASTSVSYTAVMTKTVTTAIPTATSPSTADTTVSVQAQAPSYTLDPSFDIGAETTTRSYSWTIAQATGSPDGFEKIIYTINGQMPGPLVEANEGDTIQVTVTNVFNEGASIHWHGMFQNGTAYMDGVPGFSQCPIPAGATFTYSFSTAGQYGTYWYHSHTSTQYTDGIMGPMIIHSIRDPYKRGVDFQSEQVILLQDWYHDRSEDIAAALLTPDGYKGNTAAPPPQSNLINGVGYYNCSLIDSGECTTREPASITVKAEKIRFRVINGGSHSQEYVSIDLNRLRLISADGTAIKGPKVKRIPIHNGQRYDFIVDFSKSQKGDSYWLRSIINANCFAYQDDTAHNTARLAIHIGTNGGSQPTSNDWSSAIPSDCVDLPDSDLTPVVIKHAPRGLTVNNVRSYYSNFGTLTSDNTDYNRFFVNSTTFTNHPFQPFLATINNGCTISSTDVAWSEAADDEWAIDIIINNKDHGLDHPYHLHGADFFIVARGTGVLAEKNWNKIKFNTKNPPRRDTIVIPGGSHAVLRIYSDIPGVWPLHCHIAWHLAVGECLS
jgi:FtsP/CotA-like multicopper oxidase with cupredoxin domain